MWSFQTSAEFSGKSTSGINWPQTSQIPFPRSHTSRSDPETFARISSLTQPWKLCIFTTRCAIQISKIYHQVALSNSAVSAKNQLIHQQIKTKTKTLILTHIKEIDDSKMIFGSFSFLGLLLWILIFQFEAYFGVKLDWTVLKLWLWNEFPKQLLLFIHAKLFWSFLLKLFLSP